MGVRDGIPSRRSMGRAVSDLPKSKVGAIIASLPRTPQRPGRKGDRGEPIPTLTDEETKDFRAALAKKRGADGKLTDTVKAGKREVVRLSDIETPQGHVRPDTVGMYVRHMAPKTFDKVKTMGVLAHWQGRLVLVDGNHRTSAALLLGWQHGTYRVIDLEP